ncbi:PREDICTED: cytosolic phospholipase A2 gamma isoform X2 [Gekko japonicus]|uniref:Cytosolic phospholipase A2 gamma isoform X2 n=1 Tax=Gekko japonicus TaxID=146911 RepID=A0ABM1KU14_GEKJA|nr:PREDICTED: cytosolic phospholipase A2 gamma isoform X2 [Gekko japonicus]
MDTDVAGQGTTKVRLSTSLSKGEKEATDIRKEKIKEALAAHKIPYDSDTVPNIAVLGSGGGLRAMLALCGTLVELQEQNLLDCIMYLSGVSGSAWCMSSFYKTENWAERLKEMEKHQCETLTQSEFDFEAAAKAVLDAASDENYSLTDFWAYFIVHKMVKQLDETTLSEQRRSSESGKNPYPVYAAVNSDTFEEDLAGTWFEFTPHEVGVPGLGAYVDLRYFGSVFENRQLKEEKPQKNMCYLQGLWGSALGSEREIYESIKDSLGLFPNQDRSRTGDEETWDFQVVSTFYQAYQCVVELHLRVVDGKEVDALFDKLEKLLNTPKTTKSYEMVRKMRKTWPSSDATKRKNDCIGLGKALESDFGVEKMLGKPLKVIKEKVVDKIVEKPMEVIKDNRVVDTVVNKPMETIKDKLLKKPMEVMKGKTVDKVADKPKEAIKNGSQAASSGNKEADQLNPRGKPPSEQPTEAANVGYRVLRFVNVVRKTYSCLLTWTWGTINNFLYKCSDVNAPALTEEPVLSLIDAGLAINTAYPLILHPERNVKLILSFDFSSGDPFETLKKTVDYCKTQKIPFPRIDEKELNDTENPRDCYIFRGDNGLTVMHFPLFNKVNCPGKIKEYSDQFSTFKRNYTREETEKLIVAAKKNVINVRQKILEEIKRTMGSQYA